MADSSIEAGLRSGSRCGRVYDREAVSIGMDSGKQLAAEVLCQRLLEESSPAWPR